MKKRRRLYVLPEGSVSVGSRCPELPSRARRHRTLLRIARLLPPSLDRPVCADIHLCVRSPEVPLTAVSGFRWYGNEISIEQGCTGG